MSLRNDIFTGLSAYQKSWRFIRQNDMLKYFVVPAFISTLLFTVIVVLAFQFTPMMVDFLSNLIGYENLAFKGSGILIKFLNILISIVFIAAVGLVYYLTYKYVMLIILSPYLAYVSEQTEHKLTGKEYVFDRKQFVSDVWRGIKMNIRNMIREIPLTMGILLLGLIPVVGSILAPVLLFIVSGYFVGFGMIDFYYERQKMTVSQTAQKMFAQKGFTTAIGAGFNIVMFIPIIGLMIAPVLTVITATHATIRREHTLLVDELKS